jgi:5'-nucleotidase
MKPRIAIDMDDVLADTAGKFTQMYLNGYADMPTRHTAEQLGEQSLRELLTKTEFRTLHDSVYEPGFFRDIPVMPGAKDTLPRLLEKYDIFITTAAMEFKNSFVDKYDWLQEHFPCLPWRNFVFCGDKSIILADVMIDDMPYNLATFSGETKLLFHALHNRHESLFTRVQSWADVEQVLL